MLMAVMVTYWPRRPTTWSVAVVTPVLQPWWLTSWAGLPLPVAAEGAAP